MGDALWYKIKNEEIHGMAEIQRELWLNRKTLNYGGNERKAVAIEG